MHNPPLPVALVALPPPASSSTGQRCSTSERHPVQILLRPPASTICTTHTHPPLPLSLLRPRRLPRRQTNSLRRSTQHSAIYKTSNHQPTSTRPINCAK